MNRKLYWALGVFILLIIGVTTVILIRNQAEMQQMEADLEIVKKEQEHPIIVTDPPPADPGSKWVRHGDHWDKVPISTQQQPTIHTAPVKQTNHSPLTYHKELL